jgi:hypothetical protein
MDCCIAATAADDMIVVFSFIGPHLPLHQIKLFWEGGEGLIVSPSR